MFNFEELKKKIKELINNNDNNFNKTHLKRTLGKAEAYQDVLKVIDDIELREDKEFNEWATKNDFGKKT